MKETQQAEAVASRLTRADLKGEGKLCDYVRKEREKEQGEGEGESVSICRGTFTFILGGKKEMCRQK